MNLVWIGKTRRAFAKNTFRWYAIPLLLALQTAVSSAQVTLTGTSYSQDFDAIGSGLPSGWDTRISATASSLGTVQSFTTTATAWGDTSGRFGNVAAAESPATSADASGTQASRTDRALAVRQSGSFGDPGAAFNFYFNASGVTFSGVDPALSVKMQQFDNQGRAATWSIQYGIGASPASWTTLGTWDTVAGWNSANVTFTGTDLAALSGQAAAWIRVVALSASTGSGSRDRVGIDDFTLTYSTAASAPTVSSTAASGIGTTAATVGGNVTADGGASVTDRGVVYKTGSGVTISDNKTAASPATGTGSFSINLSSLSVNQQYYHRAYAINSSGTTLGTELSFHTLANTPSAPTVNNATVNSLDVTLNVNGNPAATTFAIEADTNNDSVYDGYVQANGSVSASAVWQTAATWGTRTVGGLSQGQTVAFRVKARNGANVETAFGGAASGTTASGCNAPTVNTPGISSSAVCAGESVTLTANTTGGTAPFNYQWKRNGSNVGANSATYEIASAAAGDAGSYTVTVTPQCGGAGVESASASLTVNALPTITLGSSPAVCRGTTSANLPYSATTGSPDQYSIDFNAAAESAGFSDVALTALGASPIAVTVPGGVAAGTYNATITVRRNSTGCAGTPVAFTITVHAPPTASVNSPSTCSGSSATMTATPSGGQGPYSYAWSVPPGASNPGNTASFSASVAGIYSVVVTDNRGCASDSAQGTLTVNSFAVPGPTTTLFSENMGTPSSTTAISANTFENASLTFTGTADVRSTSSSTGYTGASAGGNVFITTTVGTFFQIAGVNTVGYQNLALSFGIYKSTTAGTGADLVVEVSADGSSYTALSYTALPSGSGTAGWYYRTATGTIPATANLRIRFRQTGTATQYRIDDVQLTGSGSQVTTATVTPSSGAICSGNALRLTATTNGASYAWAVPAGASNPGNVSSFDASVAGTYTVTITDANGCTATAQATLTTATAPSLTLGGSPTVCQGATSASLPYSGATGSPDQYSIDFNAAAESAGFNDVVLASLGASPIAITVPGAAPAGAYTGTLTVRNSGQGCDSAGQSFTVTISGTPAQPGTITQANPAGTVVCTGAAGVTYTIAAVSGATSYNWTLPVGASITAGDGTTSITVNWGSAASGSVSVQAVNACASGTARTLSVSVTAGAPSAPTATAGSDVSPTAFTANWQPLAGATGYLLDVSETEDFSGAFVVQDQNIASGATVSYALSSLTSGATYFYRVRAYNACGNGPYSATVTVLTPLVLAGWDMSGLSNFGPSPMAASMSASGVTVGGLTRGSGVGIGGTAAARGWGGTNWNGASASAAEAAGQFATFTVAGNAGVSVSFNQVSRFDYRRSTTGPDTGVFQYALDGVNFVDIATVTYSSTASSGASVSGIPLDLSGIAALQDVAPGVTVTFRIVNHGGSSTAGTWYLFDVANSTANDFEIRGTLCATPTAYTVTGGGTVCAGGSGTAVGLSGSQAGVSYQLLRDATPVGSSVAGTGGAISFGLHTTAGAYTVEATRNSGGCDNTMNGSVAITVNTAPSAPTGLAATPGNGQVELNWNATGGATAYRVKRGTSSGGPFSTLAAGSSVAGTTFTDATAQNGNTYYYVVSALNGPCEGPNSSSVQASLAGPPPDAPVALTATAVTPTSFQANWNAASGATSYRFDVATENTFSSFVAGYQDLALGNVTLRAVSGLAPGQTYYFRVRAQNSSGISEDSNAITVTLPSSTTVAISGLAAVDANTGTINFGATANAYYDVYYSDSDLSGT
ncbi:MAG TPA: fibronectin type III domain-containing protein, partial [Kiritimatiellia bacterium]|nr:fibronectin type III domain-containing protein [Kiritimatiellia bacterium]